MDKADHHSGSDWFYTREVTQQMQIHQENLSQSPTLSFRCKEDDHVYENHNKEIHNLSSHLEGVHFRS